MRLRLSEMTKGTLRVVSPRLHWQDLQFVVYVRTALSAVYFRL